MKPINVKRQCPSVFLSRRGRSATVVFCEHDRGHAGEHKGFRKRWTDAVAVKPPEVKP